MAGKRSIFEEVGQGSAPVLAQTGGIDRGTGGARMATRLWVPLLLALMAALVVQGGLMRLFDSGLLIPSGWPVTGLMPPMSEAGWAADFARIRQPRNSCCRTSDDPGGFSIDYLWAWSHRQLARLSVLVWASALPDWG